MTHHHYPGPQYPPQAPRPKKRGGCLSALLVTAALGIGMIVLIAVIAALSGPTESGAPDTAAVAEHDTDRPGAKPAQDRDAEPGEKPKEKPAAPGIGDTVEDGVFAFTVTKVEKGVPEIGEGFLATRAQGQYVLVHLTVKNIGDRAQGFSGAEQKLIDAAGREFDADLGAAALAVQDANSLFENINPGNTVNGVLVFDVPKKVRLTAIELHDSPFSNGVTVTLS